MGLLDGLIGQVAGQVLGGGNNNNAVAFKLLQGLMGQSGGMAGVFQKLQAGGLGNALASWVGNGANQSVSADAIANAFGSDLMSKVAGNAGMETQEASGVLAQFLPNIINNLTPNGNASEAEGFDLSDGLDMKDITALMGKLMK